MPILCQLFAGSMAILSLTTATVTAAERVSPNVLLICVDDLKPTLGCYGDTIAKTPHIDRLAARGLTFDAAYCNQAVCSPSRNALLVGLRPQSLGIYDLATNFRKSVPDAVTLPQYFRQHGYRAEALGKIFHVGHGNTDDQASWDVPLFKPKNAPTYALPSGDQQRVDKQGKIRGSVTESADVDDESYHDGAIATEAVKRLEEAAKQEAPFFLAVGFIRPHLPFVAPKRYWEMYDPNEMPMPAVGVAPQSAPEYAPTSFGELRSYAGVPQRGPIDQELTRHLIHGYYAATSYTDAQVGRLLDALDRSPVAGNTIIVLWGDHGWHLGDHGMWCKHTNYEQAARIPVIVSVPGMAQGAHTQAMIESVDIYPTLTELAGLPGPSNLDGISVAKVMNDPAASARPNVVHVYPRGNRLGRAVRSPRYRMVQWKPFGASDDVAEYELYDYEADPLETKNLAAAQPEIVKQLQAVLATHPDPKPQRKAGEATQATKSKKANSDRVALFEKRDRDRDESLTMEEFMQNQSDPDGAKKRFPQFDANGDGVLSRAEFIGK